MKIVFKLTAIMFAALGTASCLPTPKPWSTFTLADGDVVARPNVTSIAAVSRIPDSLEVFWIGPDGSVNDTHWYEGQPWKSFVLAPAGSAEPQAGITAVSRQPTTIEVFWIGKDGSVQNAHWYEGANWQRYALAPANSASTKAGIAAVSAAPDSIDVFWITANGRLNGASWQEGRSDWITAEIAVADLSSSVSAVARNGKAEVFYRTYSTASEQTTCHNPYYDYQNPKPGVFERIPCTLTRYSYHLMSARSGSSQPVAEIGSILGSMLDRTDISAVSRQPDTVEVFFVTSGGGVGDAHWYDSVGQWKGFALAGGGSASVKGGIASSSRKPGTIEVLWVGQDGSIQNKHWYDGSNWEGFELAPADSAATDGDIAMISRIPASLESFWASKDGALKDSHWYE